MHFSFSATIRSPLVAKVFSAFEDTGRRELNTALILRVRDLIARRLVARTGASANDSKNAQVVALAPVQADTAGASFSLDGIDLGCVLHDITVRPPDGQALTIPMNAFAGRRPAGDFHNLTPGSALLARRDPGGAKLTRPLLPYPFANQTTQTQDRSPLPGLDECTQAASEAARQWWAMKTSGAAQ